MSCLCAPSIHLQPAPREPREPQTFVGVYRDLLNDVPVCLHACVCCACCAYTPTCMEAAPAAPSCPLTAVCIPRQLQLGLQAACLLYPGTEGITVCPRAVHCTTANCYSRMSPCQVIGPDPNRPPDVATENVDVKSNCPQHLSTAASTVFQPVNRQALRCQ